MKPANPLDEKLRNPFYQFGCRIDMVFGDPDNLVNIINQKTNQLIINFDYDYPA